MGEAACFRRVRLQENVGENLHLVDSDNITNCMFCEFCASYRCGLEKLNLFCFSQAAMCRQADGWVGCMHAHMYITLCCLQGVSLWTHTVKKNSTFVVGWHTAVYTFSTHIEVWRDFAVNTHCVCLSNSTWYLLASGNQIKWATAAGASFLSLSFLSFAPSLGIINFIISVVIIVKLFFIFLLFFFLNLSSVWNTKCMLMCCWRLPACRDGERNENEREGSVMEVRQRRGAGRW